jgi:branched-subunit amino acid transport protein
VNTTPNNNAHERARSLIALAGPETLSAADQTWLAVHLEMCDPCRAFAQNATETIHRLRAIPIAAGRSLVSITQLRVRHRALELQRHRERMWLVVVSCAAVTLFALLSTIALWSGFEWLGARAQLPSSVWQVAFLVFCVLPALVAGIVLLAKDKHLAHRLDSYRG